MPAGTRRTRNHTLCISLFKLDVTTRSIIVFFPAAAGPTQPGGRHGAGGDRRRRRCTRARGRLMKEQLKNGRISTCKLKASCCLSARCHGRWRPDEYREFLFAPESCDKRCSTQLVPADGSLPHESIVNLVPLPTAKRAARVVTIVKHLLQRILSCPFSSDLVPGKIQTSK